MIFELLENGRRTKAELMTATGLSERELTRRIEFERQQGAIILSDSGISGYFLPENDEQIRQFVSSMARRNHRIYLSTISARQYLKSHSDDISGQMSLEL